MVKPWPIEIDGLPGFTELNSMVIFLPWQTVNVITRWYFTETMNNFEGGLILPRNFQCLDSNDDPTGFGDEWNYEEFGHHAWTYLFEVDSAMVLPCGFV